MYKRQVNTSRTKKDGIADEKAAERKLKWDEENRLLEMCIRDRF